MNTPPVPPKSLAWRLTMAAIGLQVLGTALLQAYLLLASPMAAQMREIYARPEMLATTGVQLAAGCILVGLVTWCTTQRWLRRHGASGVDRPGRMTAVLLALSLVLFVLISVAQALLQHAFYSLIVTYKEWVDNTFGFYGPGRMLVMGLPLKLCGILLTIVGSWLAVRIAAWSVKPGDASGAPSYLPRHAAWIAALTLLLWQLHAALALGGYFTSYMQSTDLLEYALGYWVLPALILALAAWVCLKRVPQTLGTAGFGRAISHGTFAFWMAQALGIGLAVLAIRAMTWNQLVRAAETNATTVVLLLAYGALLALGCHVGARLFYRRREAQQDAAPA
ncbi:hypothetical protein D9M68_517190 [compost metagenome]|uniref:Uncharacterized protein n=1 Tax=Achromobacter agilis TaxID=1353888 RepID=A0A446C619_9BURK|nr:hypothetical protein [Achromobacter agilis]SSW63314.1 hypothetical protein AGI3411_01145 [Achromobacter agilis]